MEGPCASRQSCPAMSELGGRRAKAALSSGCKPHPAIAPAGSNRSSNGVLRSHLFEGGTMAQSHRLSSAIPFVEFEPPACPKCKAQMMLISIEPVRACVVDLHTFECAVCNQVLKTF